MSRADATQGSSSLLPVVPGAVRLPGAFRPRPARFRSAGGSTGARWTQPSRPRSRSAANRGYGDRRALDSRPDAAGDGRGCGGRRAGGAAGDGGGHAGADRGRERCGPGGIHEPRSGARELGAQTVPRRGHRCTGGSGAAGAARRRTVAVQRRLRRRRADGSRVRRALPRQRGGVASRGSRGNPGLRVRGRRGPQGAQGIPLRSRGESIRGDGLGRRRALRPTPGTEHPVGSGSRRRRVEQ